MSFPRMDAQIMEKPATPIYIHPTALVETEMIGYGTRVWAFTHVSEHVIVGSDCNIGSHCYLESGVRIGDRVTIKNGNLLWAGVTICDGAFVGPQVAFTNDLRPRSPRLADAASRYNSQAWLSPTLVQEGVSIGAAAVILAGVTLGKYCMVAAGAVVTKTVPSHALVMGTPARIAGWVCCCGKKLDIEQIESSTGYCEQCFYEFQYVNGEVRIETPSADHVLTAP
jgi:UDP-2-acetamido-3-amino-2,3-dideoxy-glucuronate N-acetyltransferase